MERVGWDERELRREKLEEDRSGKCVRSGAELWGEMEIP